MKMDEKIMQGVSTCGLSENKVVGIYVIPSCDLCAW